MNNGDFIAIRYTGGAGGQFLNGWLTKAKYQDPDPMPLGEFGSGHRSHREIEWNVSSFYSLEDHLNLYRQRNPSTICHAPWFFGTHCEDQALVLNSVGRVITITYQEQDCREITLAFLGKYMLENPKHREEIERNCNPLGLTYAQRQQRISDRGLDPLWPEENWMMLDVLRRKKERVLDFQPTGTDPRVMYVSWTELMHLDPQPMIDRLGQFTGMPLAQFDRASLEAWRRATSEGMQRARVIGGS
jgi:hypothetical protein